MNLIFSHFFFEICNTALSGYLHKKTPHLLSDEEHFLEMEVDFLQPLLDIKARTALANPGEVAMA